MRDRARSRRVWRRAILIGAVAALAVPAGVPHQGDGLHPMTGAVAAAIADAASPRIEITKHAYSVATVTIPAGGTVTWTNRDDDVHTVVSTTNAFRSPAIDTDETYEHTFAKPGVYPYFCTLHPLMTGTIIVK